MTNTAQKQNKELRSGENQDGFVSVNSSQREHEPAQSLNEELDGVSLVKKKWAHLSSGVLLYFLHTEAPEINRSAVQVILILDSTIIIKEKRFFAPEQMQTISSFTKGTEEFTYHDWMKETKKLGNSQWHNVALYLPLIHGNTPYFLSVEQNPGWKSSSRMLWF